ncbi:MAG TPA: 2-C-methyl-D-erythritol 2,4-cyclodiphosphate synthase [Candidatus Eisenbacteria bacterium]|jgi:2-C-methyl-D-erythritol 2,4-cyclodiphosphate synthase|nr:2-C-methyl-D-erythritol 2,4-cyclodiphosphate synthase [Candidatus Eisenbacteria bacterium]
MRVGIGYDIHALKRGRRLVLGGVEIPHDKGLAGHSDGDALWHAVLDAVLGAMGEGDIGDLFPDTDPRHKGAAGAVFAREVSRRLKRRRLRVVHVDSVVIAEAPKLGAFKRRIRESLAKGLGLPAARVGVKAKTNEGFGDVGKKRAIACHAVAVLAPVR